MNQDIEAQRGPADCHTDCEWQIEPDSRFWFQAWDSFLCISCFQNAFYSGTLKSLSESGGGAAGVLQASSIQPEYRAFTCSNYLNVVWRKGSAIRNWLMEHVFNVIIWSPLDGKRSNNNDWYMYIYKPCTIYMVISIVTLLYELKFTPC